MSILDKRCCDVVDNCKNSQTIREIQNQAKKYKRDKAQYKFWKDQEFIGNNRAGRRRK